MKLRKITSEELKTTLENHKHWLNEDCKGWENMRADLSSADLSFVDLSSADLRSADLSSANLRSADLSSADLRSADLRFVDLSSANLRSADLSSADLSSADLSSANLRSANLRFVDLSSANLRSANLRFADLSFADLSFANLSFANLRSARNVPFIPYSCPDFGSFIGYKKARGYIVELEILSDSKRLSATGRKCRCDRARVLSIQNIDGTKADVEEVKSDYDSSFIYKVGKIVRVDNFDEDRWKECSPGIHFFINRQEAVDY